MSEQISRITKIKALWLPAIQDENTAYMSVDVEDAIWIVGKVERLEADNAKLVDDIRKVAADALCSTGPSRSSGRGDSDGK